MPPYLQVARRLAAYGLLMGYALGYTGCKPVEPDSLRSLSTDQITIVQALNRAIIPLGDPDPTRNFADLVPLDTVLANALVVGMGEGTHGTREFFRMKDRLFRYLVQQHGHQNIAFEANFGRAVIVNRFIHGQNTKLTSAAAAAKSMYFWTWKTDEVRELLQWMRDYNTNKSGSQQLSFYGFDCQFADDEFPLLSEFLAKVDPPLVARVDSLSALYTLVSNASITTYLRQQYRQRLPALYALFVENEPKWVAMGGRQEYEIARQAARILIQQQDLGDVGTCDAYSKRDQYMAENVQWLLTRMDVSKVSLWAHNYHIGSIPDGSCNQPSMGAYLKRQLENRYLIVGTSLSNGSFTVSNDALSTTPVTVLSVRTEGVVSSFNYLLGKEQYASFALNLNQSRPDSAIANWVGTTHPLFEVGAGYNQDRSERYYGVTPLRGRYDMLIHFRNTTPTQLLP